MSQAPRLWRLARPIAAIVALLTIVAGLLAPTATAQTGGGYPPPGGPIGSISGRVVDAETGLPIQATVTLFRCDDFGCNFARSDITSDFNEGRFRFVDFPLSPLPSGAYYIVASAFQYQQVQTPTFLVADGENFVAEDIVLPRIQTIGNVTGRIVDSVTGQPVNSFFPSSASIFLLRCFTPINCNAVAGTFIQSDGTFLFSGAGFVFPTLEPGLYAVEITSQRYETLRTTPVEIGVDENWDLGELALVPIRMVNSIRGRLVDSVTGGPVSGTQEPFANVSLNRCESFGCFFTIASTQVDASGNFRFDNAALTFPLVAGDYQIIASADQYVPMVSGVFSAASDQDVDLGNVKLQPYPVRFSNAQGCQTIPASGGICRYSVRVTSGIPTILDAASWSIVQAQTLPEFPYTPTTGGSSSFQPEPARNLRLKPGQSQVLSYELRVPAGAANGTSMCVSAFISKDRTTRLFNTIGQRQLFCVVKADTGPFRRMTDQEIRDMERDGRGPRRP